MRLATFTAVSLLVAGIGASVAYAFFFVVFFVAVSIAIVFSLLLPGSRAKQDKIVQKTTLQLLDGTAQPHPGDVDDPASITFSGTLSVKKSKPSIANPPTLENFSVSFPVTKTNSSETKGSLKAGNAELVNFRSGINNLLTLAATAGSGSIAMKSSSTFIGGDVISSDSKQSGSVKVDKKTFTRLAGKISLKGDAFVETGPNNGANGKYKIKVKFKPRKADF